MKPLRIAQPARSDTAEIRNWLMREGGRPVARRFGEALAYAIAFVGDAPAAGSPRFRQTMASPFLRVWPVRGFPYLVFYDDLTDRTDILRILHAARDIPASLRE